MTICESLLNMQLLFKVMSSTQALLTMISGGLLAKPKQQTFWGKLAARHHDPEIQRRRLRERRKSEEITRPILPSHLFPLKMSVCPQIQRSQFTIFMRPPKIDLFLDFFFATAL